MKILLSSSTIDRRNGYGNITYELSRTLVKKGHEVKLLLPIDSKDEGVDIQGFTIEKVLPPYLFQAMRPKIWKYFMWRYKGKEKFDLVHSLFETPYAPLMARESKRMQVPFVVGAQGTYGVKPLTEQPERFFLMYAYNTAKAIIVPSQYTRDAIRTESGKKYDITIIHNGVDYERFNSASTKRDEIKNQFPDKKILLTVGQVKNRKGQDIVIRALPKILEKHPDTMYLIVGDDAWNGYLTKLAKEVGVEKNVIFAGAVASDEVPKYFHACDVYVHTARVAGKYFFEGFGIVYLEAGACGKPSVGTNAGGITDALLHEKTGFVAENENIDQVVGYVNRLLDDEVLRKQMGEEGRIYASKHTWEHITDCYIEVYVRLLKRF